MVCGGCGHGYGVLLGIPDLRIADGPYISNEGDWEKARRIAAEYDGSRFADLVALYYRLTPEVPARDAARFTQALLSAPERARGTVESWLSLGANVLPRGARFADVGCGTAPMLVATSGWGLTSVGLDVSLRWLVIARKRLDEAGLAIPLVCANAEALPFGAGSLDAVAFDSSLEHFRDGMRAVRAAARVLAPGGRLLVSTPNRWSVGPDPHLGVWAGGWWPERVTNWIARRAGALVPLRHLIGAGGLRRWLGAGGFEGIQIIVPRLSGAQLVRLSAGGRAFATVYNRFRGWSGFGGMLKWIGPILHAVGVRSQGGVGPPDDATDVRRADLAEESMPVSRESDLMEVCVGCGDAAGFERLRPYRLDSQGGQALFGQAWLVRCRGCGLVQSRPIPGAGELGAYYAGAYRQGGRHGAEAAVLADFPRDNLFYYHRGQSIAALLDPYLRARGLDPKPRVLDVGAGFGHLLQAFAERFPTAIRTALEISEVCFSHLGSLGIRVIREPTESWLARGDGEFDVILLSHVLEHLRHPSDVLTALRARLSPTGLLFVEVPHIPADSLSRYLDHPWAPRFDEPHPFFSVPTFEATLHRAKLEVLYCHQAGPAYRELSRWRFHLPQLRPFLVRAIPSALKRALRHAAATRPLQTFGRAEPFFEYGAGGIWIRSVSARGPEPG